MDAKFSAERLKLLRKKRKITQEEISKMLGITRSAYASYETGANDPPIQRMIKMARILSTNIDYLLGIIDDSSVIDWNEYDSSIGEINMNNMRDRVRFLQHPVMTTIKVYGTIPAGTPIEAVNDIIDEINIPATWMEHGNEFFGLEVKGDSMSPKYETGDIVILKVQNDAESGSDCAVYVNGYNATLKRIQKTENSITLVPLNPSYQMQTFKHPGDVTIIGKVVELRRTIK